MRLLRKSREKLLVFEWGEFQKRYYSSSCMQVDDHEHADSHEMLRLVTHPHQGNLWESLICYLQRIHRSSITRGVSAAAGEQWQRALHLLKECIEGKDCLSVATQHHTYGKGREGTGTSEQASQGHN